MQRDIFFIKLKTPAHVLKIRTKQYPGQLCSQNVRGLRQITLQCLGNRTLLNFDPFSLNPPKIFQIYRFYLNVYRGTMKDTIQLFV